MRFSTLGPLLVHDAAGEPVTIGGARLRTLLGLLLLSPDHWVTTDRLLASVWEDAPPVGATNALQALVSRLRRALAGGAEIEGGPQGYRLAVAPDRVDLFVFEDLVREGRSHRAAGRPAPALADLERALGLWRGPALVDLTTRGLAEGVAARLAETRSTAREERLAALLDLGRTADAVAEAEALAEGEPHRERPLELLVRALAAAGRTADALDVYARFRARLADDLGLDPSPRLAEVHLRLLRGELSAPTTTAAATARAPRPVPDRPGPSAGTAPSGGAPVSVEAVPVRLPVPLTGFVPRAEVDIAVDLLSRDRLVTLLGPGGAGKTRLAVEAATAFAARVPGLIDRGAWFVELAPLTEGVDIPDAVADTLGLREHALLQARSAPPPPPAERVAAFIADQPLLLVLDNCEHLVADAARFTALLLSRCPRLRVLATSREPLGTPGEHLLPVPSLSLPAEHADAEEAAAAPSVVLFTERARAVRPGFAVTDDNVPHVVRIVRALDGMPLALELAAARLRVMTPDHLADRLDDRFRLLGGGVRRTPRHSTLRAVVDWSWDLLDEAGRRLLRRLSVFAGGASLDSLERVCADPDRPGTVAGHDVWTVLFDLVDKSLVIAEDPRRAQAPPRYRLLETVRAYAAGRLADAGEVDRVRDAHARHVRDLWRTADPLLRGPRQGELLARLHDENDDFALAVRWALERRDVATALDLIEYSQWYWTLGDSWEPLSRWSKEVLDLMGDEVPAGRAVAHASCLFHLSASSVTSLDDVQGHVRAVEEALAVEGLLPEDHPLLVYVLMYRVILEGDGTTRARIARALDGPDPWMRAMVRLLLSLADALSGRLPSALEQATEALEGFRALDDAWGQCQALAQVIDVRRYDDLDHCRELMAEGILLAEGRSLEGMAGVFRIRRAQIHIDRGDLVAARADLDLASAAGGPAQPEHRVLLLLAEAQWERERGEHARARALVDRIGPLVEALGGFAPTYVEVGSSALAATISWSSGDTEAAWREAGRSWWSVIGLMGPIRSELLEVMAAMTVEEDPHRAALLMGWSVGLRGVPDTTTPLVLRVDARLRDRLGDGEYTRIVSEAAASPAVEILEKASRWLSGIVPDPGSAHRR
ncbi:AfsR/SARP family transcriptional regulator [Nocardiopsis lambiniae]|uniref:BTAD domain-containing putative transcriptional regulator n=1 Tax=Nocardiopsis lambiniae TaxID=3075539 RepID=A0ABU2MAJ5_9ACTN|nr:BTAD domain-containing putative transcriptional regulator [Nocardiopsis sp. DSM 44743]MDT0329632.1 BTAD domain-containing putative transcriptional regulator [Nocardiopsis sp. DSM 44743]